MPISRYYSHKRAVWFAFLLGCEAIFIVAMATAIVQHNRLAELVIIVANVAFAGIFLRIVFLNEDMARVYETDGSSWIRGFGRGYDVIAYQADFVELLRNDLNVEIVTTSARLLIVTDSRGYETLRAIAEAWAARKH